MTENEISQGFHRWLSSFCVYTPNAGQSSYLGDAYKSGWTDGQFALNNELGIAANEAAKDARRKAALEAYMRHEFRIPENDDPGTWDWLDAIIKEAQG